MRAHAARLTICSGRVVWMGVSPGTITTTWLLLHCSAREYAFELEESTSIGTPCEQAEHAV
jgi:hypothetical protein